jgi:hypothetical protein
MPADKTSITTVADATIPDPEELDQRDVEELHDIPVPEKVRRDFNAGGEGADDEDVALDDDRPKHYKDDLNHGDEGID